MAFSGQPLPPCLSFLRMDGLMMLHPFRWVRFDCGNDELFILWCDKSNHSAEGIGFALLCDARLQTEL